MSEHRRLPRYRTISSTDALKVDKIVGNSTAPEVITTKTKPTPSGDSRRLRGIPLTGADASAINGTNPLAETIRRDEQRRKRAA